MSEWLGDHPFFLMISTWDGSGNAGIDLDEQGWMAKYAEYMRIPSLWQLIHKDSGQTVLAMTVHEGEQPYYTAQVIGITGGGGTNDIRCFGIGKKLLDGHIQRLWWMPNGVVVGGNDQSELGVLLVKQMGPR